uniref:Uncharacterized protein n=1 Tax=Eucampia antarctica TaxID=49252 RepID=A0A7S2R8D7_9STRA
MINVSHSTGKERARRFYDDEDIDDKHSKTRNLPSSNSSSSRTRPSSSNTHEASIIGKKEKSHIRLFLIYQTVTLLVVLGIVGYLSNWNWKNAYIQSFAKIPKGNVISTRDLESMANQIVTLSEELNVNQQKVQILGEKEFALKQELQKEVETNLLLQKEDKGKNNLRGNVVDERSQKLHKQILITKEWLRKHNESNHEV